MFHIRRHNQINYKRQRLIRVITKYQAGGSSVGSGFFINSKGRFVTCFHVIFGSVLAALRLNPSYLAIPGADEHTRLQNYFNQMAATIEVEFADGTRRNATLLNFHQLYDVAVLNLVDQLKTPYFDLDFNYHPAYDEPVFFCGFQMATGYSNPELYPFATNSAEISSFPETIVGGDNYRHIQLNSINLGGNSGAPLFLTGKNKVIGIINGNMNWGADNVAFVNNAAGVNNIIQGSLRTPLSIAFATSIRLIKEQTSLFN